MRALVAAVVCGTALLLLDSPEWARVPAALVVLVWAPGEVVARCLHPLDAWTRAAVVIAAGLSVTTLVTLSLLYAGVWTSSLGLVGVAALTALGAILVNRPATGAPG